MERRGKRRLHHGGEPRQDLPLATWTSPRLLDRLCSVCGVPGSSSRHLRMVRPSRVNDYRIYAIGVAQEPAQITFAACNVEHNARTKKVEGVMLQEKLTDDTNAVAASDM